jgi:nucleoside-diphosphate-sugar epimerase
VLVTGATGFLGGHVARLPVRSIEAHKSDQRVFVADHARATTAIGWRPTIGVDEGLTRTIEGLRGQRAGRGAG